MAAVLLGTGLWLRDARLLHNREKEATRVDAASTAPAAVDAAGRRGRWLGRARGLRLLENVGRDVVSVPKVAGAWPAHRTRGHRRRCRWRCCCCCCCRCCCCWGRGVTLRGPFRRRRGSTFVAVFLVVAVRLAVRLGVRVVSLLSFRHALLPRQTVRRWQEDSEKGLECCVLLVCCCPPSSLWIAFVLSPFAVFSSSSRRLVASSLLALLPVGTTCYDVPRARVRLLCPRVCAAPLPRARESDVDGRQARERREPRQQRADCSSSRAVGRERVPQRQQFEPRAHDARP